MREKIAHEVIKTLHSRFQSFPEKGVMNRNAPFHEAFLEAFSNKFEEIDIHNTSELITISSWLHGLNTSLGQSFFENVACIISGGEKRTFKDFKVNRASLANINEIMSDLKNGKYTPEVKRENDLIHINENEDDLVTSSNFTADLYVETDDEINMYELKSVRPNSGEMKGEKEKILRGKAYLKLQKPDKKVNYYMCIPYDPTEASNETNYNKDRYMKYAVEFNKFIAPEELLLSSGFWEHLSGEEGTMEEILEIIRTIATPKFQEELDYVNEPINRGTKEFNELTERWSLITEHKISLNVDKLNNLSKDDKTLQKLLNNTPFDKDGKYKLPRALNFEKVLNSII